MGEWKTCSRCRTKDCNVISCSLGLHIDEHFFQGHSLLSSKIQRKECFIAIVQLLRRIHQVVFLQYWLQRIEVLLHYLRTQSFCAFFFKLVSSPESRLRVSLPEVHPPVLTRPIFVIEPLSLPRTLSDSPGECLCYCTCKWEPMLCHVNEV